MTDKPKAEREFTYHVGWKKGKIRSKGQTGAESCPQASFISKGKQMWRSFAEQMLWREAPYPSAAVVRIIVYGLPVASFAAAVWLVCLLSDG